MAAGQLRQLHQGLTIEFIYSNNFVEQAKVEEIKNDRYADEEEKGKVNKTDNFGIFLHCNFYKRCNFFKSFDF